MLYLWGRNNNHLIRNNHKQTYSIPQKISFSKSIYKCACGNDFLAILTTQGQLYFLYQSAIYKLASLPKLIDIATSEGIIVCVTYNKCVLSWEFNAQILQKGDVYPSKITVNQAITSVTMGYGDIFLQNQNYEVFHCQKNQWHETKSYSNVKKVKCDQKIIQVASGQKYNLFLTYDGSIYSSKKRNPLQLTAIKCEDKFIKISAQQYQAAINKAGAIVVWGKIFGQAYSQPTIFAKLTKKFIDISLGIQNGYAIADDGEVWIWGKNAFGQLGVSDYQQRIKPFPLITLEKQKVLAIYPGAGFACCLCQLGRNKICDRRYSHCVQASNLSQIDVQKNKISPNQWINNVYIDIPAKKNIYQGMKKISRQSKQSRSSLNKRNPDHNKSLITQTSGKHTPKSTVITPNGKYDKQNNNPKLKHHNDNNASKRKQQAKKENNQKSIQQHYIKELFHENATLKTKLSEKQLIITDLIKKMKILEAAIEEHQKTLTNRDYILEEYQRRQKQYICHINELQKSIQQILKGKNIQNQFSILYEDLKKNFQKQREYYLQKITAYEEGFKEQRHHYRDKIKELQNYIHSVRQYKTPLNELQQNVKNRGITQVDKAIQRIEQNKNRISKSANKLLEMIEFQV